MNSEERPSKKDAFMAFFSEGWVSVHLDARRDGVKIPPEFADNRHLVLQYGSKMPIPIPDLKVNDEGIRATLSFARTPHETYIPWSAIYIVACTDGRGVLYYEDVPEDVSLMARPVDEEGATPIGLAAPEAAMTRKEAAGAEEAETKPAPVRERFLKSVPAEPTSNDDDEEPAAAARRRKRPQLKVVK